MTILEKKVDRLIKLCLEDDTAKQKQCKDELRAMLKGKPVAGTIREEAMALMLELGISPHLQGYAYAVEAICFAADNCEADKKICVIALWEHVADRFETTWMRVERCVRHAVERCFKNCDWDILVEKFGNTISPHRGKLTCGEFISVCTNIVKERCNGEVD